MATRHEPRSIRITLPGMWPGASSNEKRAATRSSQPYAARGLTNTQKCKPSRGSRRRSHSVHKPELVWQRRYGSLWGFRKSSPVGMPAPRDNLRSHVPFKAEYIWIDGTEPTAKL